MHVETCVILWYLLKTKKYYFSLLGPFLGISSTLPSTQTIKVIGRILFYELAMKNWAIKMHFNPIPVLQKLHAIWFPET